MIERWSPIALGILAGCAYGYFGQSVALPKTFNQVLAAIVTVSGVAVGFFAAAQAILLSIENVRVMEHIRKAGYDKTLVRYITSAVWWSLVLSVLSTIGLLADFDTTHWHWSIVALWVGVLVAAFVSGVRILVIFEKILRSPR